MLEEALVARHFLDPEAEGVAAGVDLQTTRPE